MRAEVQPDIVRRSADAHAGGLGDRVELRAAEAANCEYWVTPGW